MRPQTVAPHEFAPVFDWAPPRNRNVSLISFIAASTVLHALCFYVFQIIYPPTVALLPPPARVTVITPATEDGRHLLRWIEAEDPALSSTTQLPPDAAAVELPRPAHVPSYVNRKPALKEPPPYEAASHPPSAQPPAPVPVVRPSPAADPAIVTTRLMFDGVDVGKPDGPPLQFTASSKEPPQAARFHVAISSRGDVRHVMVESSSGDAALDAQASGYLLRTRFRLGQQQDPSAGDSLRWTTALIEWGNDIHARPPLPAGAPKS